MTPRRYFAVWVDFLHRGEHAGRLALNVQEVTAGGAVVQVHRRYVDGPTPPTENQIIALVLPGAVPLQTETAK